MPVFVSYNREDSAFVDKLAARLVMLRHSLWIDRWEMNIGDSLITKIQSALTESDAMLVILSRRSVASEWCRKELNSGLMRELEEKRVLVLPCIIDDCEIPLFLREKLYADFRHDPDHALTEVHNALLRIGNAQQGRHGSPDFHTDWSYDWGQGRATGLWYFTWTFIDHGAAMEHCILTRCQIACNEAASEIFNRLHEEDRRAYICRAFGAAVKETTGRQFKIVLPDVFEKAELFEVNGFGEEQWLVEISSRRVGVDNGKDILVHVDQVLERALHDMKAAGRARARG